jgi:flagellar basal body-associated protein FliL
METLMVILLAVGLMAFAMAGMAITMLIKKGGKFPNTHVSGNKYLKKNGVYCSQTQDRLEQRNAWKNMKFGNVKLIANDKAGN